MTECSKIIPQSNEALLSSADGFTAFSFGGYNIRFRSPYSLERYVDVVKWDDGYLVVLAKYSHNDEPEEEYILLRLIGKEVTLREGRKRVDMEDFVIPFNLFSLRDAIAFSETGVELTMRIMQFQNREQSVGTPIDILTLTPDGAKWKQIN